MNISTDDWLSGEINSDKIAEGEAFSIEDLMINSYGWPYIGDTAISFPKI